MTSITLSELLAQPTISSIISTIRATFPNTLAIYVFGSRVKGNSNAESDLDLAVLVAGYADPLRLWEIASDLAEIAGCDVDLLDMRATSTVMQYQILQTGRRLWAQELEAGLFECFVLSEKLDFDQARAGLLADIQQRGTIYG
ncbi:MAG: nucleotidyltransferase domain-containing protein [Methylococcaceae bacterium]|jgi:predicted nucleotidyltransferase